MKKIILFLFSVLCVSQSYAQWGVKGGLLLAKPDTSSDFTPQFYLGGTYDFRISDEFYIQPQLLLTRVSGGTSFYAYKKDSNPITDSKELVDSRYSMLYTELPILMSYRISTSKNTKWHLNFGSYVAYGIFRKYNADPNTSVSYTDLGSTDPFKEGFRANYGFMGGVAYELNKLVFSTDYKYGFSKSGGLHPQSIFFGIGYKF